MFCLLTISLSISHITLLWSNKGLNINIQENNVDYIVIYCVPQIFLKTISWTTYRILKVQNNNEGCAKFAWTLKKKIHRCKTITQVNFIKYLINIKILTARSTGTKGDPSSSHPKTSQSRRHRKTWITTNHQVNLTSYFKYMGFGPKLVSTAGAALRSSDHAMQCNIYRHHSYRHIFIGIILIIKSIRRV